MKGLTDCSISPVPFQYTWRMEPPVKEFLEGSHRLHSTSHHDISTQYISNPYQSVEVVWRKQAYQKMKLTQRGLGYGFIG